MCTITHVAFKITCLDIIVVRDDDLFDLPTNIISLKIEKTVKKYHFEIKNIAIR